MPTLKIYAAEREAGLEQALAKTVVTVQASLTVPVEHPDLDKVIANLRAHVLAPDVQQPDLAWIVAVLVSTGWNRNTDVFLPAETYAARNSPVHKPIDLGHDDGKIIGHLVTSRAVGRDGAEVVLDEKTGLSRTEFDIEVGGVLYKALDAYVEEVAEIIEAAKRGEARVSMECFFSDFAYAFRDPKDGTTKVVLRNESTAFLTKHLLAYGGTGEYEGHAVGRVLLNIRFGGMGVVDQPANPRSIVKEVVAHRAAAYEVVKLNEVAEGGADLMEKELADLKAQVAEAELLAKEKADLIAKLEAAVAERDQALKGNEAKLAELGTQIAALTQRAQTAETELAQVRQTQRAQERLAELKKIVEIADEAATLAELAGMTDEAFSVAIKYAGQAKRKANEAEGSEPQTEEAKAEAEAQAALDGAKPTDNEPDLQGGSGDTATTDLDVAKAMASRLLRRKPDPDDAE